MSDHRDSAPTPAWIDAEACRIVGVFLDDESLASELESCMPLPAAEFETLLAQRRSELVADGASEDAIAYRIAVMRHTRDALILRAQLRALPTAGDEPARAPARRASWRARRAQGS
ncbi:MAG TPA: hypothetical protein VFH74_16705 [Gaiellales bacterium]|nr:hypothetical protein [Gaiellales bacterium]